MLLQIDNITIEYEACNHCRAVPTEQDALLGIANHQKIMGVSVCARCGEPVYPTSYELVHMELPDGAMGWYAAPTPRGKSTLWVRGPVGTPAPTAALHPECAKIALPHLSPDCFSVQVQNPWPDVRPDP